MDNRAKQATALAFDELAASIAAGKSEGLTRFLDAVAKFHRYSFGNVMLMAMQRPDATHVAGFHTWLKVGRHVRKGEKGIMILAPMIGKRRPGSTETETEGENESRVYGFRAVHVFDVSQTDGDPLPELDKMAGDPAGNVQRIKDSIASRGIALRYSDHLGGASGTSAGGIISILNGLDAAQEFAVLAHELAHESLHHVKGEVLSKTVRETEAEAVAFIVCRAIGLEPGTACSDYIQMYAGDKETLAASLHRIQETAVGILKDLDV